VGGGVLILAASVVTVAAASADRVAPYDIERFRPVLEASKLQAPTSSPAKIPHGRFAGRSNPGFYFDADADALVFTATGSLRRSELRQMSGDWDTATPTVRRLIGRIRVLRPETPELDQFTCMQIHASTNHAGSLNKPLIRLTWRRARAGVEDHLWAGLRTPADPSRPIGEANLSSEWIDLGPRPHGFFLCELEVSRGRLRVRIDGTVVLDRDVAYWNGQRNYFKAGVYNQGPGMSLVQFRELAYGHGREVCPPD
jgi:hypothetical protein